MFACTAHAIEKRKTAATTRCTRTDNFFEDKLEEGNVADKDDICTRLKAAMKIDTLP